MIGIGPPRGSMCRWKRGENNSKKILVICNRPRGEEGSDGPRGPGAGGGSRDLQSKGRDAGDGREDHEVARQHTVREGECIDSIAARYGLFPERVWGDGANAELRRLRQDPNVLQPGDVVVIPEKRAKEVGAAAGKRHRFRRKGVPARLRLTLRENGAPRAGLEYILEVDGALLRGITDAQGRVDHPLPPDARRGRLILGEEEEYHLDLGGLDPVDEEAGVRARLDNLGFLGGVGGDHGDPVAAALRRFQEEQGLEVTGVADGATRDALVRVHGS